MSGSVHDLQRLLAGDRVDESRIESAAASYSSRDILVTGAGGFIGSALAKSIAAVSPRSLVLLDASEYNLFEIQRRLAIEHAGVSCEAVLGSVEDAHLLATLFTRFRPQVVFHAAAFKHVALLERNPFAAVRNNVLGTHRLAVAAIRHGCSSLCSVSTDKAVHPHSVMGVSKRIAELITVALSGSDCRMNAIRLGNVIGSSGSAVPIFLEQIANGGPVTVTDPQASRYFLTLTDTRIAILLAGTAACDGCILLPQMERPVRIAELAQHLIEAQRSDRAISIRFTGLRPGEKLTEDLIGAREKQTGSAGPLAVIETEKLPAADIETLVNRLSACVASDNFAQLLETLCSAVPEYEPSEFLLRRQGQA